MARLAGVDAGRAEEIEIDVLLENEGVPPDLWRRAEPAWRSRLAEDAGEEGPLQAAYDARLADAQDRHGRPVAPLDEDLASWLDFVRSFSRAEEPLALLRSLGLRATDIIRLHRRWSRALEADASLRARAERLLGADPGPMPEVHPGETTVAPPPPEGPPEEVTPPLDEDLDEDDDDDLDADEDEEEGDSAAPDLWVPLQGWPAEAPGGPQSARVTTPTTPSKAALPSFALAAMPRKGAAEPPPFQPSAHAPIVARLEAVPPPHDPLGSATAPAEPSPFRAALPFQPSGDAPLPTRASPPRPVVAAEPEDLGSTTFGASVPGAALPFQQGARAPDAPRPLDPPSAVRSSLPFRATAPQEAKHALGMTAPPGAMSPFAVAGGVPFKASPSPPTASPASTLEHHASLCADLAFNPADAGATLRRYRLSPSEKAELDRYWESRIAADPPLGERWREAYRLRFALVSSPPRR